LEIKAILFFMLFMLSGTIGYTQQNRDFSAELKNTINDSLTCTILDEWANALMNEKPDTAIVVFKSIIIIAENASKKYQPKSRLHNHYIKALASANNNIGIIYFNMDQIDSAEKYLNCGTNLLITINEKEGLGDAYSNMGGMYFSAGNPTLGIEYTLKGLVYREEIKDTAALTSSYNNLGYFYYVIGNIPQAMHYYNRCLKISEFKQDKNGIAMSLMNIGAALYILGEKDKGLNYFFKSLNLFEELKNYKWVASILSNIGNIYTEKGDTEQSLNYYTKAIEFAEKVNSKSILITSYYNLGNLYTTKNELEKASNYYKFAIDLNQSVNDKSLESLILTGLSKLNLKLGKINQALDNAKRALIIAQEIGSPRNIGLAAEQLKTIYRKIGDNAKAIEMFELSIQMRDSVQSQTARKASIRTQIQYEYDLKENQLKAQSEKEAILAQAKSQKQKIIIWSIGLGLLLVLLFSLLLINRLHLTRKQKTLIDKKNAENELLLSEIHHRVKNNLQVISSLLSLQERSTDNEGAKSAILEGKERVKSMELVHKMLYQNSKFSGIEMQDYVNKLSLGLLESFGLSDNEVKLNTNFQPLTLDVDTAVPLGLILNELIVNSLKYAKNATEKLQLKIELQLDKNNALHLNIADNGKGKVSDIEKSNSFGLKIVKALIRQLNGAMEIKEDQGLNYSIVLKNYKLIA